MFYYYICAMRPCTQQTTLCLCCISFWFFVWSFKMLFIYSIRILWQPHSLFIHFNEWNDATVSSLKYYDRSFERKNVINIQWNVVLCGELPTLLPSLAQYILVGSFFPIHHVRIHRSWKSKFNVYVVSRTIVHIIIIYLRIQRQFLR